MSLTWSLQVQFHLITHRTTSTQDANALLRELLNQPCFSKCSLINCRTRHKYIAFPEREPTADQQDLKTWSCSMRPYPHAGPAAGPTEGEVSTTPDLLQKFRFHFVCLESPKFPSSLPRQQSTKAHRNHGPHFSFEWQVNRLLRILGAPNLDELVAPGIAAIYTNASTHLRVRISTSDLMYAVARLQTFKNLLSIAATYERLFDSIRPASGIRRGPFDAQGWTTRVQEARTWGEIYHFSRNTPPEFSTRLISSTTEQGVRFVFPGSLVAEEIFYAVDVARSLFAYAEHTSYAKLAVGMRTAFAPSFAYTLSQFLQEVGISRASLALVLAKLRANRTWPSYAESVYAKTMFELSTGHFLYELLKFVALEKRVECDMVSIEMVINQKMRDGEYGWYPRGASVPWHSSLPIFDADVAAQQISQTVMQSTYNQSVVPRHDSVVYEEYCSPRLVASDTSERSSTADANLCQDAFASRKAPSHTPSSSWTSTYHDALEHQQEIRSAEPELKEDLGIDEHGLIDWHFLPLLGCGMHSFRLRRWSINLPLSLENQ